MTARHQPEILLARDEIVAPPAQRACEDRTFEFPPALHILTMLMFLGFVTVLSLAFRSHMLVPWTVFAVFIVAFFLVPGAWARMKPEDNRSRALRWNEFMRAGIATATGRTGAAEATALVLVLPFLVFCWALAIAIIAAVVR